MIDFPDYFYQLNIFSITLRLVLAMVIGGVIGLERGSHRHPAGFRTHMLVCVGAAMAMLTNDFIVTGLGFVSDPARIGAQVITGVGFLGVGTIFLTGKNQVRGLTTAAGLWPSACLGLALGIGFYTGAFIGALLIFISLALLPRIEQFFYHHWGSMKIYLEARDATLLLEIWALMKEEKIHIQDMEKNENDVITPMGVALTVTVMLPRGYERKKIIQKIRDKEGITIVEEL